MASSAVRIKISLAFLSIAFLLNMSAYMCLEGLQSSLNAEAGTISLTAVYSALVITSLFLPTLAIDFLNARRAMGVATLCYAVYSLANCYPRPYTLIPGAIIMGSGGAVLWSAGRVYISDLATAYAKLEGVDTDKTMSSFYGIFMGVVCCCFLIGNLVTSFALQSSIATDMNDDFHKNNTESYAEIVTTTISANEVIPPKCGMHNCDAAIDYNSTTSISESSSDANAAVLIALFASFAGVQIISALVIFFGLEEAPKELCAAATKNQDSGDESATSLNHDESKLCESTKSQQDRPTESRNLAGVDDRCHEKVNLNGDNKEKCEVNRAQEQTTAQRVVKQALATGKFMLFNSSGRMLIPLTLHIGLFQGFALGQFTKYWVTCVLGIQIIGYAISVFGVGAIIGSYGSGLLTQLVGRRVVLGGTFLAELAVGIVLFVWEPETNDETWIFLLIFGIFGILHAITKTIPATLYSIFFPNEKEAANAAGCIWDALGSVLAYAISARICNVTFTIILLSLSGVGTLLYFVTERVYEKSRAAKDPQIHSPI